MGTHGGGSSGGGQLCPCACRREPWQAKGGGWTSQGEVWTKEKLDLRENRRSGGCRRARPCTWAWARCRAEGLQGAGPEACRRVGPTTEEEAGGLAPGAGTGPGLI